MAGCAGSRSLCTRKDRHKTMAANCRQRGDARRGFQRNLIGMVSSYVGSSGKLSSLHIISMYTSCSLHTPAQHQSICLVPDPFCGLQRVGKPVCCVSAYTKSTSIARITIFKLDKGSRREKCEIRVLAPVHRYIGERREQHSKQPPRPLLYTLVVRVDSPRKKINSRVVCRKNAADSSILVRSQLQAFWAGRGRPNLQKYSSQYRHINVSTYLPTSLYLCDRRRLARCCIYYGFLAAAAAVALHRQHWLQTAGVLVSHAVLMAQMDRSSLRVRIECSCICTFCERTAAVTADVRPCLQLTSEHSRYRPRNVTTLTKVEKRKCRGKSLVFSSGLHLPLPARTFLRPLNTCYIVPLDSVKKQQQLR